MYTSKERQDYFNKVINLFKDLSVVGIVQIGSGVTGYYDEYSDIDLMVAVPKPIDKYVNDIYEVLKQMGANFIHEGKFGDEIFLLIPFFENGLEMDISIMPVDLLSVKSPLWKVIYDPQKKVEGKLYELDKIFRENKQPYRITPNIKFQYFYLLRKSLIELKRNNLIGALSHTHLMKEFILEIQILKENKKLHQFKRYQDLDEGFQMKYLSTYEIANNKKEIEKKLIEITNLFLEVYSSLYKIPLNSYADEYMAFFGNDDLIKGGI
ncbi:nucleotidyltransferase domain-containing protein [Macrococcus sp. DPC7161]|uniref:nucleotidyltransferase domain-containing protein n=1 Tax=Macrococcus sp. DPC7161 TaxID=2507060 RepID=UPI00100C0311|nr:nucleotidyltransferase domain-containing protein [Macrococcus sp. DPC7161]RXK19169.1 hypothetical protein ER639_02305 [Macrococcus sp. DPC7161]